MRAVSRNRSAPNGLQRERTFAWCGPISNPSSAKRIAGASTSASVRVPNSLCASTSPASSPGVATASAPTREAFSGTPDRRRDRQRTDPGGVLGHAGTDVHPAVGRERSGLARVDRDDAPVRQADQQEATPADPGVEWIGHTQREGGRHGGVDGIAAPAQDLDAGAGRIRLRGSDRADRGPRAFTPRTQRAVRFIRRRLPRSPPALTGAAPLG
jgi:hypothetical protein